MSSDQLKKSIDSLAQDKDKQVVIRVSIPSQNAQKVLRANVDESIWHLKVQIIEKMAKDVVDALNYGLHLDGALLDEKVTVAEYALTDNTALEFKVKCKAGVVPNTKVWDKENNKKSWKKFMDSIQAGKRDEVKAAVAKGLDPNFTAEDGLTPLIKAVMLNDRDMIQVLIECGAVADYRAKLGNFSNPKAQNALGSSWLTPVHVSASESKLIALQTLMFFGASCNVYDSGKFTPLYHACANGHEGIVRWILVWGAINGHGDKLGLNLEEVDQNGKTLLHQACSNGFAPIVTLLLEHGADPNAATVTGNTALHMCCIKPLGGISFKDCTKELLSYGADKERKNKASQTAYQIALMSGNMELSDLVKKYVIDPSTQKHPNLIRMIDNARVQWGNIGKMMSMGAMMTGKPLTVDVSQMSDDHTMNMYGTMRKRASSPTQAINGSMRSVKTTHSAARPGLQAIFGEEIKAVSVSHLSLAQQAPTHMQSRTLTEEDERSSSKDSLTKSTGMSMHTLQMSQSSLQQQLRGPQGLQSPLGAIPPPPMSMSDLPPVRPVISGARPFVPGPPPMTGLPQMPPMPPTGIPQGFPMSPNGPMSPGQFPMSPTMGSMPQMPAMMPGQLPPPNGQLPRPPPMPANFPSMPNIKSPNMPNFPSMPPMPNMQGMPNLQGIPNMPPGRPPMNSQSIPGPPPMMMRPPPQQ